MIEVLDPGPLSIVQDLGRTGHRALGVCAAGAADHGSHRLANRLVGNDPAAATIEITLGGLWIRALDAVTVAFTGARCSLGASVPLAWATPVSLPAGTALRLGTPARGLRSYLAVRGGIDVPPVLGSRSTDTLSGLGPPPLAAGDRLEIGTAITGVPSEIPAEPSGAPRGQDSTAQVCVWPGPRCDLFGEAGWQLLTSTRWQVDPTSNRIGVRLGGPGLRREPGPELPSEPTLPGAIQVPGNGRPIVLGPDAPVTGGYPVIGVVAAHDLDQLAQLRPGDTLRLIGPAQR